jgi:integrase
LLIVLLNVATHAAEALNEPPLIHKTRRAISISRRKLTSRRPKPIASTKVVLNSKPLSESNIVNRWLHPMLEQLKAPKAGNHAFRRFRITHLRKNLVPKDLEHSWMGHADEEIGDLYSKLMNDVQYRKDVAERVGTGFDVPLSLNSKADLNLVDLK